MLTTDKYIAMISSLGVGVSSIDIPALLYDHSQPFTHTHNINEGVDASETYRLPFTDVLLDRTEFFIADTATTDACTVADVTVTANLQTVEAFSFTDPAFVQTEPIAFDPAFGIYRLLTPLTETEILIIRGVSVVEQDVLATVAFQGDMCNPIKSYKKGPIEVKTRSLQETLKMNQELEAISGKGVVVISTTRYSGGKVKGRRNGV